MLMKKKWNPYKNLKIWGSYSPEWLSECDHTTAQDTLFSLYWKFGLFSSPRASKDWCDMATVGERHLDCLRASVWPTLLSICMPNLLKEGESLLKDREIISLPEIMLPHTSCRYFHPDEWYKCFCIMPNFLFLLKKIQTPQTYSSISGAWNWSCKLSITACRIRSELTQLDVQT